MRGQTIPNGAHGARRLYGAALAICRSDVFGLRAIPRMVVTALLEVPNEGCELIGASFRFGSIFWCKRFNTVDADFTGPPAPFSGGAFMGPPP
jgi:hypothetical protein